MPAPAEMEPSRSQAQELAGAAWVLRSGRAWLREVPQSLEFRGLAWLVLRTASRGGRAWTRVHRRLINVYARAKYRRRVV